MSTPPASGAEPPCSTRGQPTSPARSARLHGNAERLRDLADAQHRARVTLQDETV
ncbi:hypothetical protein AB0O75_31565 [Streptomyces sp. NPDC088921]|uniref:hypothetical protein n=1 Tax=unclassified Streptomyces TaxID=2593676 RepID=UPI0034201755